MDKYELKNNADFTLNVIVGTLASFNLILGFDLKNKKLVFKDIDSNLIIRVNLEDLNKVVLNKIKENEQCKNK